MLPGFRVRFHAGATLHAGTIASTAPVPRDRVQFTFLDRVRWTFMNSDLFVRVLPDEEADAEREAEGDEPIEFVSDDLAAVPA